jgi:exodeoxyribonuclease VII large subunit
LNTTAPIRLSDLAGSIRQTLDDAFGDRSYWVMADVTNHKFYAPKGHHYFDLVEKGPRGITTRMNAVAWWEGNRRIRAFEQGTGQTFGNDIHVLVCVTVEYHVVYGLKLTVVDIDARFTLGQLEEQRQATLERLLRECPADVRRVGDRYLTSNMDLPFRKVIQRIAVITSEAAAGYEDFRHSIERNTPGYRFQLDNYFTRVQGQDNADDVAARIYEATADPDRYDAVVIIRGGGAQTDLIIFDQFIIARAVAASPIPVITGIGHLRNETITDMMAHTVTKTPTECAEFIIGHNRRFEEEITGIRQQMLLRVQQLLSRKNREVNNMRMGIGRSVRSGLQRSGEELVKRRQSVIEDARRIGLRHQRQLDNLSGAMVMHPGRIIDRHRHAVAELKNLIGTFRTHFIGTEQARLEHLTRLFRMASPEEVLRRGFAIVKLEGRIIADADEVTAGKNLQVILKGTEIETKVVSKKIANGTGFDL